MIVVVHFPPNITWVNITNCRPYAHHFSCPMLSLTAENGCTLFKEDVQSMTNGLILQMLYLLD
jgi:hypothetical protein